MTNSETQSGAPNYRGWLAVVIILGALIMLAVGAMIGAAFLAGRNKTPGEAAFTVRLDAPGAHIESATLEGNRVVLKLAGGTGGEEIVILDAESGRIVGRVGVK